jgi:hypothetical protein
MFRMTRANLMNQAIYYAKDGIDEVEFVEAWKYSSVSTVHGLRHFISGVVVLQQFFFGLAAYA